MDSPIDIELAEEFSTIVLLNRKTLDLYEELLINSPSHNLSPDMNMQPKQMYLVREKSIAFFSVPRMIGMTHFV
ncbi:hypothetical protein VTN49DRAFT_868 [Thermomyces lanuginosus]|uniref:uncharacterized protein n=1 Tax=Thermomyces lanuginosus TaxID=5541 RepID=UPI0037424705